MESNRASLEHSVGDVNDVDGSGADAADASAVIAVDGEPSSRARD